MAKVHIAWNGTKSFLLGASWAHDAAWPERLTHIYLGPFLLIIRKDAWRPHGTWRSDG